jgi:hypothetical protein
VHSLHPLNASLLISHGYHVVYYNPPSSLPLTHLLYSCRILLSTHTGSQVSCASLFRSYRPRCIYLLGHHRHVFPLHSLVGCYSTLSLVLHKVSSSSLLSYVHSHRRRVNLPLWSGFTLLYHPSQAILVTHRHSPLGSSAIICPSLTPLPFTPCIEQHNPSAG